MVNDWLYAVQPSVYNLDGSGNPECDTIPDNWFIYDYSGFENTKFIYDKYSKEWKDYRGGFSYNEIVPVEEGDYPLVKSVIDSDMNGRWYIPGFGEMQYIVSKYQRIQDSLTKIQTSGRVTCDLLSDSYFTSTITNTKYDRKGVTSDRVAGYWMNIDTLDGIQEGLRLSSWTSNKNFCHRARPMCRYSKKTGFKSIFT